jgi:hypothetical protein
MSVVITTLLASCWRLGWRGKLVKWGRHCACIIKRYFIRWKKKNSNWSYKFAPSKVNVFDRDRKLRLAEPTPCPLQLRALLWSSVSKLCGHCYRGCCFLSIFRWDSHRRTFVFFFFVVGTVGSSWFSMCYACRNVKYMSDPFISDTEIGW